MIGAFHSKGHTLRTLMSYQRITYKDRNNNSYITPFYKGEGMKNHSQTTPLEKPT